MASMVSNINRRHLTSNTQKVAYKLLTARGWVSRSELERHVPNATARARDLRKPQFGGFTVECAPAAVLGKRGDANSYFYRIPPKTVTKSKVQAIFG